MMTKLYPLKFDPIFKERIWGGQKLGSHLGKNIPKGNIGESWEISDVEGDTSVVSNGKLKGFTLSQLQEKYREKLIGKKNHETFGNKFPLLIKFIDAREDLSIQLHPDDKLAKERHNSFGKTEMWYIIQVEDHAKIMVDFSKKLNKKEYLRHLDDNTLPSVLNMEEVKGGDAFLIEGGRVHAIGAGVMLAEIQQTSDITYRIYDWNRTDAKGKHRELHTELALDAINFNMPNDYKVEYDQDMNKSNRMVDCKYFTTNYLTVNGSLNKSNNHDSFIIYICVEGQGDIHTANGNETIRKGETLLMPAEVNNFSIHAKNAMFLEVYV